jgi:hypothetical protein
MDILERSMNNKQIVQHIVGSGNCDKIHCDGIQVEPYFINDGTMCPLQDKCPVYAIIDGLANMDNRTVKELNEAVLKLANNELRKHNYAGYRSNIQEVWSTGCIQ